MRLGAAGDLFAPRRQPRAGELTAEEIKDPGVRVARGVNVDLVERNHVAPEDHRLEVEAAAPGQHARGVREQLLVDLLLSPGPVLLGRAEVLEGAEARDRIEGPIGIPVDRSRVLQVDVEVVFEAGGHLRRGQRHADPVCAAAASGVQQRPPAAAEVEQPPSRSDPDLLRDVVVLAALRLLERQREIAVVLGAAEVGELAQAEPEDPVDRRVGELDVSATGHGCGRWREVVESPGTRTPPSRIRIARRSSRARERAARAQPSVARR